MRRTVAFIAVTILSCTVLSAAAPVLQCIGKRQSDGQFYFNMSDALNKDVKDCETQWVINGTVVGISDADGNITVMPPLVMATANAAIVQTCHEKLEYLLICPSAGINKKEQCSLCFPDWTVGVIGVSAFVILLVCVIVAIVCYKKKSRSGYGQDPAKEIF